ncbi:tryptophan--tRNA ligase [Candidatus Sumerlaeota bacterium]|nr:tryptophan--tRNA ligase [Candidatus Sumerlaeota bacterium]
MAKRKRILSGNRPTGLLHLGNYVGALRNWVRLQDEYECFFMVADWHALTSDYADPSGLELHTSEMILDWLAVGLDPERSTLFIQSKVKQHAELNLLLSMITPLPWLERCPTYKDQIGQMANKDLGTHGFLGYPVLQAADIVIYKAHAVPVGEDQVPHVEMCRELVRRFNNFYGEVFPEPQHILSPVPKMLGVDGRKMSKSYDNCIYLKDSRPTVQKKVRTMVTDPARVRRNDPGHPEVCSVFDYHKIFNPDEVPQIEKECRAGSLGCVDCKTNLGEKINRMLDPFREKRAVYQREPKRVAKIVQEGNLRAQTEAEATLAQVREAMHLPA